MGNAHRAVSSDGRAGIISPSARTQAVRRPNCCPGAVAPVEVYHARRYGSPVWLEGKRLDACRPQRFHEVLHSTHTVEAYRFAASSWKRDVPLDVQRAAHFSLPSGIVSWSTQVPSVPASPGEAPFPYTHVSTSYDVVLFPNVHGPAGLYESRIA